MQKDIKFPDINDFLQLENRHRSVEEFKQVYSEVFAKYKNPPSYLEVGCWAGWSLTIALLCGAGDVTVVELDPKCIETTKQNLIRNGLEKELERVTFIQGDSREILPTLKPAFNIILLDGDYHYETAKKDLINAIGLAIRSTTLICHDVTGAPFSLTNPMEGKNAAFQCYITGGRAGVKCDVDIQYECFGVLNGIIHVNYPALHSLSVPWDRAPVARIEQIYKESIIGVFTEEVLNAVHVEFILALEHMEKKFKDTPDASQLEKIKALIARLRAAKTDAEKMISIDQVINTAHRTGIYGWYVIEVNTEKEAHELFERIHIQ